ncbi:MAG: c-type cytochrome [Terracidiphilus sp.]
MLPKELSGQQVHDIMEQWASSLGARCDACHVEDTENAEPDGRPHLDFSDDSKPMKAVARRMYTMTEEINGNYIAKVNGSGMPVTCGTCHRGRVSPELFTVPPAGEQPPAQVLPSAKESRQP